MAIYDDRCGVCINFAKTMDFFTRGEIRFVGNHSKLGLKIRDEILGDDIFKMFWFLDEKFAYGGRASITPLLRAIFNSKEKLQFRHHMRETNCEKCSTVKMAFVRIGLFFSESKKVKLK